MRVDELTDLYGKVRACHLCALAAGRTQAVPGTGPANAEIMFIGEAPGFHEDRQGLPFVGAAGKFLDELLASAGIKRQDVYICNVVKCRPPANRDPLPDEIEASRPHLDSGETASSMCPCSIRRLLSTSLSGGRPSKQTSRSCKPSWKKSGSRTPRLHPGRCRSS
jgi:hypothetical protein